MPPLGARVLTPEGEAKVIGHEILSGQVLVVTEDRRRLLVDTKDAQRLSRKPRPAEPDTDSN